MKSLLVYGSIVVIILIFRHIRGWWTSRVEHPSMDVEREIGDIRIVRMPSQIVARVRTQGTLTSAPGQAFGTLAGYIFGDNRSRDKIAMTAPVTSTAASSEKIAMTAPVTSQETNKSGIYITSFIMPSTWTIDTLPLPNNDAITIEEQTAMKKAVWTFDGYATAARVKEQWELFQDELDLASIVWTGSPTLAQYNDPRTPPRMRRNELWVDVVE